MSIRGLAALPRSSKDGSPEKSPVAIAPVTAVVAADACQGDRTSDRGTGDDRTGQPGAVLQEEIPTGDR